MCLICGCLWLCNWWCGVTCDCLLLAGWLVALLVMWLLLFCVFVNNVVLINFNLIIIIIINKSGLGCC